MKIKSARYFREKYMTDIRHINPNTGYDPSFVGCNHKLGDDTYVKGFFDLYHGDKSRVGDFLSNFLKIAEDGQAIYEFLQNAADCNSTLFYMFYNEKYFLAINNGDVFNQAGLRSLLNVAQSTKSTSSQIGRFGIGFKLVHRLVGKGDGVRELTQDYKGPIMFSWSRKSDLINLIKHDSLDSENDISDDSNLPYLLKLILTNFPTEPNEVVRDLNYKEKILFDDTEYAELCEYVATCISPYLDVDNLNQGSLFFIKLGEGKKKLLDQDYEQNLKAGVEYSLNTLKRLDNVKINGTLIEKIPLKIESGIIKKDSVAFNRIDPEYKDDDIHYSIGYNEIDFTADDPFRKIEALKKSPTFYKYFPLGDEIHQSAIFIHCDSLSNEANRRKMHEDSVNKELIPEIAKFIVRSLSENKKNNNISSFCQLYANLLLSDTPHDNSDWLKGVYYDIIQEYLVTCIPTQNSFASDINNVKIRRICTNVPLSVINNTFQWFKWSDENVDPLLRAAKDKLGITELDIVDLIIESNTSKLNSWISSADETTYMSFINEVNSTSRILSNNYKFIDKIREIKIFKFSDNNFYSYEELVKCDGGQFVYAGKTIFLTKKTEDIMNELYALGFIMSCINIDLYPKIRDCFILPKDKHLFSLLKDSVVGVELLKSQKKNLISHIATQNAEKKWADVGVESIQSLQICHNNAGELVPLCDLIGRKCHIPEWLSAYQIKMDDYFDELDKFLMPEQKVYTCVIYKYWDDILVNANVKAFYEDVIRLYNLDADNNKTLRGKKYIFTEDHEFVCLDDLIFNSKMLNESLDYKSLNNVITTIFRGKLPNKNVAEVLAKEPFGLNNDNICDRTPKGDKGVVLEDIQNILKFCALNNETFFKEFLICFRDNEYFVDIRGDNYYQVYTRDQLVKSYIKKNYSESMVLLPDGIRDYKDSEGIVSGASLYASILAGVDDIDDDKEYLIDIVKYESRKEFIRSLSEVMIDIDEVTSNDSFSYKLLDMATTALDDDDSIENFRDKVIIKKDGESFSRDQIPQTMAESIAVEGAKKKFDLSKILPNENGNGSLLIEIVEKYSTLGIQRSKLNKLFGISEGIDIDNLYDTLIANYKTLQNDQQLAFVLQVCSNKGIALPEYKLTAINGEDYDGDFVIKPYDFINETYILSQSYAHLKDYIKLPYGDNTYIESPYINDNGNFICTGIDTLDNDEIAFEKVLSLLSFLLKKYNKSTEKFKKVDWSIIKDDLGFNPNECVFPKRYAMESETLPNEVERWAKKSLEHKDLMKALGVLVDSDPVLKFRKFMNGDLSRFDVHSLYSVECKEDLENSLKWLSNKIKFPISKEKYDALLCAIERINKLRGYGNIEVNDRFDIAEIANNSIEYDGQGYIEWKEDTGYSIYQYKGALPHIVEIDEYIEDTIYYYNDGDITDNGGRIIYVNIESDIQESLHHLAENNCIGLTREEVYRLFNRKIVDLEYEIRRLKEDNKRLKSLSGDVVNGYKPQVIKDVVNFEGQIQIVRADQAQYAGLSLDEIENYIEEAKGAVVKYFRELNDKYELGLQFDKEQIAKHSYSQLYGIYNRRGKMIPIVVHSYKGPQYRYFDLNWYDWQVLSQEGSMLFVLTVSGLQCIPLYALPVRNINISISDDMPKENRAALLTMAAVCKQYSTLSFDFGNNMPQGFKDPLPFDYVPELIESCMASIKEVCDRNIHQIANLYNNGGVIPLVGIKGEDGYSLAMKAVNEGKARDIFDAPANDTQAPSVGTSFIE